MTVRDSLTSRAALGAAFTASIVTGALTATKVAMFDLPLVGDVVVPAGFVALGVAFLCSDLLSERHGKDVAHQTVTASVGALGLAYALVYASVAMPAAPFYEHTEAFENVLAASAPIIGASIITTLVSQNLDVAVFHRIKGRTGQRLKFLRNLGSTLTSQAIDTALFITLAFVVLPHILGGTAVPIAAAAVMVGTQYVMKVGVAALDTPLFYLLSE